MNTEQKINSGSKSTDDFIDRLERVLFVVGLSCCGLFLLGVITLVIYIIWADNHLYGYLALLLFIGLPCLIISSFLTVDRQSFEEDASKIQQSLAKIDAKLIEFKKTQTDQIGE